ncbi:MAG: type II toxin-antitoxin system Phd/YefM family antitoxin [Anaerolineae bacterium]
MRELVQQTVGARELKARLGRYLKIVREGGTVVITDRGQPVGRIVPAQAPVEEAQLRALVEAGLVEWGGEALAPLEPPAKLLPGGKTVAELLVEDRA